jgi:uncharacterized protein (TIGR02246 family)
MGDLLLEDNDDNNNDDLVQNLVDKFKDAFNSHDPKMLSSLSTEDGEWTDVIGHTMIGRNEIENQHVYPFTTVLKEARLDVKSYRSKWITDEILSVDIKWESAGHRTHQKESLFQLLDMAYSILLQRRQKKEEWIQY